MIGIDKEVTRLAPHDGSPGRPAVFSDAAIRFCLTNKFLFRLPLRQTTGMIESVAFNRLISCCFEDVVPFFILVEIAVVFDSFPDLVVGPGLLLFGSDL